MTKIPVGMPATTFPVVCSGHISSALLAHHHATLPSLAQHVRRTPTTTAAAAAAAATGVASLRSSAQLRERGHGRDRRPAEPGLRRRAAGRVPEPNIHTAR